MHNELANIKSLSLPAFAQLKYPAYFCGSIRDFNETFT